MKRHRRSRRTYSREPLALGAIVVRRRRQNGRVHKVRYVKVRGSGPKQHRFSPWARWWWERNRGPIPEGKRVIHLDGDTMHDAPGNLALADAGDVAALWHLADPARSDAHFARLRAATARHNRERAAARRLYAWLPSRWYPVDFERRVILNDPRRKRWQVYGRADQPRPLAAWALGWPGRPLAEACVLAALDGASGLPTPEVLARLQELRRRRFPDAAPFASTHTLHCALSRLRRAGLLLRSGGGRQPKRWRLTAQARRERGPVCPWVPVLGARLAGEEFAGFTKIHPEEPCTTPPTDCTAPASDCASRTA